MSLKQAAENTYFGYPKNPANQPPIQGAVDLFENVRWQFDTVADLLADTTMVYTTGSSGYVAVNDIVWAQGFRYQVAASSATDHHVTTAGGVKLYVLPGDDGAYNVKAFGAKGDGTTDDTAIIQATIDAAGSAKISGGGLNYKFSSPLTISTSGFNISDATLTYVGVGTNAAITIATGVDTYISGYMSNVTLVGSGTSALVGIDCRKCIQNGWYNVSITGFTSSGAAGIRLTGATGNRFYNCDFSGNYVAIKTANFINASGGAYVPANENKFFGCKINDSLSDAIYLPGDAAAGGAQSTGNSNGFHACWIENNSGRGAYIENSSDTVFDDCRFENNTSSNIEIAPTLSGVTRINRVLNCNFASLASGTSHIVIGSNARGTLVSGNKFSTVATPWTDNGAYSRFYGNFTDGGSPVIGDVTDVESSVITSASVSDLTALALTLTDRANGNGWSTLTIAAGSITWNGLTCIQVDTEGAASTDDLTTIVGGNNGDILVMKAANASRSVSIPASTGSIRVPSGGITLAGAFDIAVFINDGFGRWNLIAYSDNA